MSDIYMTKVEQKLLKPQAYTSKTDIEKFYDSLRNAKAIKETQHECVDLGDGEVKVCAEYEVIF